MTPDRAIETAADYADALMTSRRAKNALVLILILILLVQLVLFFMLRFDLITPGGTAAAPAPTADTTSTQPATPPFNWWTMMHYIIGGTAFLGVALSIVLSFVLMLILNIMLVGRLVGAGRLTSAYIWSLIAVVLLFPWQAFLNNVNLTPDEATFKIPGVLYTWYEVTHPRHGADFPGEPAAVALLKWARYVGFPVVAILILLAIQIKSNRGLKQALGEADPTLDATATDTR